MQVLSLSHLRVSPRFFFVCALFWLIFFFFFREEFEDDFEKQFESDSQKKEAGLKIEEIQEDKEDPFDEYDDEEFVSSKKGSNRKLPSTNTSK